MTSPDTNPLSPTTIQQHTIHVLPHGWYEIEASQLALTLGMSRGALLKRCRVQGVPVRRFGRAAMIRRSEFERGREGG